MAQAFRSSLAQVYPRNQWVAALQDVYVRHLSPEDMKAALSFYQTPQGMRLLQAQPTIRAEAAAAGQRLVATRQEEFGKHFASEVASLFGGASGNLGPNAAAEALTVAEAVQACRAIDASADVPIGCKFEYLEGQPAMFVALPSLATVEEYWQPMSDNVAEPFCAASNAGNRNGVVFVSLVDTNVARMYVCESAQWSDWESLSD
jgi:hypothetical protein